MVSRASTAVAEIGGLEAGDANRGAEHVSDVPTGPPGPTGASAAQTRSAVSTRLLADAARETDPVERKRLQDEVVIMHMGLARAIALRYRGRGIAEDDLVQAATVALVRAARTFDPARGTEFLSYAAVSMKGEVKRQFRDHGWMVRPPRPIQKMQADIARAEGELAQRLGRSPRVGEVAAHLGTCEDAVLEALSADGCFTPTSLDTVVADGGAALGDGIAAEDDAMAEAETRVMLLPVVRALPERERRVLFLRFFKEQTQSQIAEQLGTNQMAISRILARVLAQLRGELDGLA